MSLVNLTPWDRTAAWDFAAALSCAFFAATEDTFIWSLIFAVTAIAWLRAAYLDLREARLDSEPIDADQSLYSTFVWAAPRLTVVLAVMHLLRMVIT